MGLKADNAQLGQSNTATNNFNLRAPLDGTLRIDRGNEGTPLSTPIKIEANNDITLLGNVLSGVFGAGQDYQSLAGSRALNTTYTNTTGKAIFVHVDVGSTAANAYLSVNLGTGLNLASNGTSVAYTNMSIGFVVMPGKSYAVTLSAGTPTLNAWTELR